MRFLWRFIEILHTQNTWLYIYIQNLILLSWMLSHFSRVQLCDPMDCSLPGSSVYGILQARILGWIAMPSARASSWPRDWTCISYISCIGRQGFFITRATLDSFNFPNSPQINNEYWYIAMLLINECEISTATPPKADNTSSYLRSQVLFIIFCYTAPRLPTHRPG